MPVAQEVRMNGPILLRFLRDTGGEERDHVVARPSATRVGKLHFWYDPREIHADLRITCMRCERQGMVILPAPPDATDTPDSAALCVHACEDHPECKKCDGAKVPEHAKWCRAAGGARSRA